MIAKLQNPAVAAALGLMLSVGLGSSMAVRVLAPLLTQVAPATEKALPPELKEKGWDFWTIEIENLSNELKEERARLNKHAEQIDQRASRVAAEERELAKLRADVEALRREVGEKIVEIKADETKNLRTLSQTYSTLTPRAAVAIIREMDDAMAVKVLSIMKTDIVGPIFEEMGKSVAPDGTPLARRAALISEKIRLMKTNK